MRRSVLAALLAVVLLSWPAYAEGERVLVDMEVETLPEREVGHCVRLHPGSLTATVQLVGSGATAVRFGMGIARNVDAERVNTMVATAPVTYTIPVEEGLYCYSLHNEGYRPPGNMALGELRRFAQFVAIKIAWSPQ